LIGLWDYDQVKLGRAVGCLLKVLFPAENFISSAEAARLAGVVAIAQGQKVMY
jgi:hypothetical protein